MRNSYIKIIFFSVLISIVTYFYNSYAHNLPPISWLALIYYSLLTICVHALTFSSFKSNSKAFISIFMGTQGIRMFFSLFLLILYLIFTPLISIPFITYFLFLYLFFAGFEIYLLLFNLRTDFKKGSIRQ